jgi:RNA polymerase sigma factor (TIGR02999 family)
LFARVSADIVVLSTEGSSIVTVQSPSKTAAANSTDAVFSLVYDELRRIAKRQRRIAGDAVTLNTTALVHDSYLKLIKTPHLSGLERAHFFAIAARAMRQILVDQARRRNFRRLSGQITLTTGLNELVPSAGENSLDMLALDNALKRLGKLDERSSQTVELRVFAGLEVNDIAKLQGVTTRTVSRDWLRASAFLIKELELSA